MLRWLVLAVLLIAASLQSGQASEKSSSKGSSFRKEAEETIAVKSEADLTRKESGGNSHDLNKDSYLMEKQINLLRSIERIVQTTTRDLNDVFAQNLVEIVSGEIINQGANLEKHRRQSPPPPPPPLLGKVPAPAPEEQESPPPLSLLQLLFPSLPPPAPQPNLEALFPASPPPPPLFPVPKLNIRKSAVATQEKQEPPVPPRPLFQLFRPPPPQSPPPTSFLHCMFPTTPPPPPSPFISVQLGKKD